MKGKTIIFFELTDYSLLRFPYWISKEILEKNSNQFFVYIHLYKYKSENVDLAKLPANSLIHSLDGKIEGIDSILRKYSSNSLLFSFAIRPPEFYVINRSKFFNIQTNLVQHGIFIPFMKRELSYFIDELKKLNFYFKSIYSLSKKTDITFRKSLVEIYYIYIKGKKTISQSAFLKYNILPDVAFVYSEYWKEYFIKNYGFSKDQFKLTGSPDLQHYSTISKEVKQEAICYICQTLVEDGRLKRDTFIKFIDLFSSSLEESDKIYLKLHPRTDLSLYKSLTNRSHTFLSKYDLPNCSKYIGHYSTLLMLPLSLTGNVFLWTFDGHRIPEYFDKPSQVGNNKSDLQIFLNKKKDSAPQKNLLEYYFNTPNLNPYKVICEHIQ